MTKTSDQISPDKLLERIMSVAELLISPTDASATGSKTSPSIVKHSTQHSETQLKNQLNRF